MVCSGQTEIVSASSDLRNVRNSFTSSLCRRDLPQHPNSSSQPRQEFTPNAHVASSCRVVALVSGCRIHLGKGGMRYVRHVSTSFAES